MQFTKSVLQMSSSPEPPPPEVSETTSELRTPSQSSLPRSPSLSFFPFERLPSETLVSNAAAAGIPPPADDEPVKILRMWKDRLKREAAALDFYEAHNQKTTVAHSRPRFMIPTTSSRGKQFNIGDIRAYRRSPSWKRHTPRSSYTPRVKPPPTNSTTQTDSPSSLTPTQLWAEAHFCKSFQKLPLVDQVEVREGPSTDVVSPKREEPNAKTEMQQLCLLCPLCGESLTSTTALLHTHLPICRQQRLKKEDHLTTIFGRNSPYTPISTHDGELLALYRELLVMEMRHGPSSTEFADYVFATFNRKSERLANCIPIQCPMGVFCCDSGNVLRDAHTHATQCWEFSFRSAEFGDVPLGSTMKCQDLCKRLKKSVGHVTLGDVFFLCVPTMEMYSALPGKVALSCAATGSVMSLKMLVVDCWCCTFRVHLL